MSWMSGYSIGATVSEIAGRAARSGRRMSAPTLRCRPASRRRRGPTDRLTDLCRRGPICAVSSSAPGALVGAIDRQLAEDLLDRADRVVDVARERSVPGSMASNSKAVTTPKLPPPPRSAHRSSGSPSGPGDDLLAGRGHDLGADEVVAGEPATPDQPADPAAERQAADTGVDERPADHREVVPPRRGVDVLPQRAAVDAHDPASRVDRDRAHPRRSTTRAPSAIAWPATLCPPPRTAIGRPRSPAATTAATTSSSSADTDDDGRSPLDRGVERRPRRVVVGVVRRGDALVERGAQAVDDELFHHHPRAVRRRHALAAPENKPLGRGRFTL